MSVGGVLIFLALGKVREQRSGAAGRVIVNPPL